MRVFDRRLDLIYFFIMWRWFYSFRNYRPDIIKWSIGFCKHYFVTSLIVAVIGLGCAKPSFLFASDIVEESGIDVAAASVGSKCPPGPYASYPLTNTNVTARAIAGSSSKLYGTGLAEGPVWLNGILYLSVFAKGSVPPSTIMALQSDGSLAVAISNTGSNGLAVDSSGMIVAATHDDGGLSRFDPLTGQRTVIINSFNGSRLNSPNDLTIANDGTIFFTDPGWQAPTPNPQPVEGVYRVNGKGVIMLVDGSLNKPNGIALSNDEAWLYVGHPEGMIRYTVTSAKTVVTPGRAFGSGLAGVDGLAMDCAGNIYVTQYNKGVVAVLNPDGATIGSINVAPGLTNAAFGGPMGKTLYLTAGDPAMGDAVYSVELAIPGRPY